MKKHNILLAFGLSLILVSCIEHTKEDKSTKKTPTFTKEEQQFIQEKTYTGLRIYTGTIPCADCSGIQQRLVMKGDTVGIYRLTETYKDASEDGDATYVSTGEWKIDNKKTERQLFLSERHIKDSVRTAIYSFSDKKLVQKNLDGETIVTTLKYTLKRSK